MVQKEMLDGFFRDPHRFLGPRFAEYDTYGDGLTQHGYQYPVVADNVVDFLISLGKYMLDTPTAADELRKTFDWPEHLNKKRIEFALSVKYDENKTRYYSMSEQKVSASPKLEWDKRYERVPTWADGSLESAFRLLPKQSALEHLRTYLDIREYLFERDNWCDTMEGYGIGLDNDANGNKFSNLHSAFIVIDNMVRAAQLLDHARGSFDCLTHNMKLDKASAA